MVVEDVQVLLERMSPQEARRILGLSGGYPSKDEVQKAWKKLAFKNHPDRGGDPDKMSKINQARDVLLGKTSRRPGGSTRSSTSSNWKPSGSSSSRQKRKKPEPPPQAPGEDLKTAMRAMPHGVEWMFRTERLVSTERRYATAPDGSTYSREIEGVILYGQTGSHHVFLSLKRTIHKTRGGSSNRGHEVFVTTSPLRTDLQRFGLKTIKSLKDHMGLKNSGRLQFYRISTEGVKKAVTRGQAGDILYGPTGASKTKFSFKGVVEAATGDGGPSGGDRKHQVEMVGKGLVGDEFDKRKERFGRTNRVTGSRWTIFVDGKEVRELTVDEIEALVGKHWFDAVYSSNKYFGERVNITRKRGGGRMRAPSGKRMLKMLADNLEAGQLKRYVEATVRAFG